MLWKRIGNRKRCLLSILNMEEATQLFRGSRLWLTFYDPNFQTSEASSICGHSLKFHIFNTVCLSKHKRRGHLLITRATSPSSGEISRSWRSTVLMSVIPTNLHEHASKIEVLFQSSAHFCGLENSAEIEFTPSGDTKMIFSATPSTHILIVIMSYVPHFYFHWQCAALFCAAVSFET